MEIPKTLFKNDEKPDVDLENYEEINPNLLKIIDKYQEKITRISNTINITELIGYFSFLTFLLMLTIRLSPNFSFNWLILLAPAICCLVSFTILLNMYLKLKDLFDESDNITIEKNNSLGSILSYFCLNTSCMCVLIYLILIALRLQGILMIKLNEISIPFYILTGILLFYYLFIIPGFLKNKIIFPMCMLGLYLVAIFIFMVMINTKIDNESTTLYVYLFLSLLITIVFHIISYIYLLFTMKNEFLNNISYTVSLVLVFSGIFLVGLKLDNFINIDNWIPMAIFIFAYVISISEKIFGFFDKSIPNDEKIHDV